MRVTKHATYNFLAFAYGNINVRSGPELYVHTLESNSHQNALFNAVFLHKKHSPVALNDRTAA